GTRARATLGGGGFQIEPGAEGTAGAAQDHDPRRAVLRELPEELPQLAHEGTVHRVERVGAVEREPGERVLARDLEWLEHVASGGRRGSVQCSPAARAARFRYPRTPSPERGACRRRAPWH